MMHSNRVQKLHSIVFVVPQAKEQHGKLHATMEYGVHAHTIVVKFAPFSCSICIDSDLTNGGNFNIAVNGTCIFFNDEPNVVSFYNDLQIREKVVEFPPGATVVSR